MLPLITSSSHSWPHGGQRKVTLTFPFCIVVALTGIPSIDGHRGHGEGNGYWTVAITTADETAKRAPSTDLKQSLHPKTLLRQSRGATGPTKR